MSKFKKNDIIICIDSDGCMNLTCNQTYRVQKDSDDEYVEIMDNHGKLSEYYTNRFKLTKPVFKSGVFRIYTHGDPLLLNLYVELAKKFGVEFNPSINTAILTGSAEGLVVAIRPIDPLIGSEKTLYWYGISGLAESYRQYNGKTDYDKIVAAFETELKAAEEAAKPKPPTVNGCEAKYAYGDRCIQFGCASIDLSLLAIAQSLTAQSPGTGNRTVQSITLSSKVSLSKDEIDTIMNYVNKVNNV